MNVVRNTILRVIAMAAVTLLIGCAHVISKEVLKDVDKNVSFTQLAKDPDAYKGKTVLFGGAIIETINVADKSRIMILQQPLGGRDRPVAGDVSEGRFIVTTQGFLDPAIYSPGRQVTVAGRVVGKEKHPLGEIEYTYPVIEKEGLYLWPIESPASTEPKVHVGVGIGVGL
jgi:outer membrane lipoprotein